MDSEIPENSGKRQVLSSSEIQYRPGVMNEVAKIVTSLYGNKNFMNDVHNALQESGIRFFLESSASAK